MKKEGRLALLAVATLACVLTLPATYYTWAMSDFDCFDGYYECRENWWTESGLLAAAVILAWLAVAMWVLIKRKSP